MSAVVTENGVEHSSIYIYVVNCEYYTGWQDNPDTLNNILQGVLQGISGLLYKTLIISNVRNSALNYMDIQLYTVTWNGEDRLDATAVDNLRTAIKNGIDTITNLTYEKIDIVCDRFLDNPTTLWTTSFEKKAGWL